MLCGLHFIPSVGPAEKPATTYYEECLDLAARADKLGYSSFKIGEHHFFDYGGYSPDPVTFLAAASQRTRRIRLATGGVFPAFTHPIKLASQLVMLDNLCHGRLDVGFAPAFLPGEFDAFQVPLEESGPRFEEGIEAIRSLWKDDEVTWDGPLFRFGPIRLLPRPVQKPHPPIWITATFTPELFEWSGRHGYYLMLVPYVSSHESVSNLVSLYRNAWQQHNHPAGRERVQMTFHCYLAERGEQARDEARPYFQHYRSKVLQAVQAWSARKTAAYPGYEHLFSALHKLSYEEALQQGQLLIGSPDEVTRQVEQLREWYGEIEPSLLISFGNMPASRARRTLDLFARDVLPRFPHVDASPG